MVVPVSRRPYVTGDPKQLKINNRHNDLQIDLHKLEKILVQLRYLNDNDDFNRSTIRHNDKL